MIITWKYAKSLIKKGHAQWVGLLNSKQSASFDETKPTYHVIHRLNIPRTDHAIATNEMYRDGIVASNLHTLEEVQP